MAQPGDVFRDMAHAAAVAIRRFQDELDYLSGECQKQGLPFNIEAAKRMYAPLLGSYAANTAGRPSPFRSKIKVPRVKENFRMAASQLEWIDDLTTRHGFFSDESPVPHALEFAFRLLQSREQPSPDRMNRFPFDGKALMAAYKRAARAET